MKRDSEEVHCMRWSSIRQVVEFGLMVFLINYMTARMESVSDAIINSDFLHPQTNNRQIFHSMNALHFVQKGIVYCICSLILKASQYFLSPQKDNRGSNQQSRQSIQSEIFLGITTFLSIKAFENFQSVFNVIFLIITKYTNFLFISLAIHFAVLYFNRKKDGKVCTKDNLVKFLKDIVLAAPVGVGAALVKLLMTQLPSFFRTYSGKSPHQPITSSDIIVVILALSMDYVLYIGLFIIKQQQQEKRVITNQSQVTSPSISITKQLSPIEFLCSWTKYTVLMFFCYCLMTGELLYLVEFMWRHPSIVLKLVEISLYYFISQWITCRLLLKYRPHVLISVMMTNGVFGKAYFHLFKSFNLMSMPYVLVLIGMGLLIRQSIIEQNEWDEKNTYSQQTSMSQIKINQYDSVNMDEKNIDYQQERIDLVVR